jgi:Protein of unknown function (DUF982)
MLNAVKWSSSVILQIRTESSEMLAVTNTREAAHCLMADWPDKRGDAYHRAVRTCGLVLCGLVLPEAARRAFLDAARESSIVVLC